MLMRVGMTVLMSFAVPLGLAAQQEQSNYSDDADATTEILHIFTGAPDGQFAFAGLVIGKNGALYGATQYGGSSPTCKDPLGCGAVYELTPPPFRGAAWSENVIYSFSGPYIWFPLSSPTVGPKGELYGTTYYGGPMGVGNVYELVPPSSPGGTWTGIDLYDFSGAIGDPQNPEGGLVIGKGGVLYGTVEYAGTSPNCPELGYGGLYGCGAVFSLTPPTSAGGTWTEQTLYTFSGGDGGAPLTTLVLGPRGELYGTTYYGGGSANCSLFGTVVVGCGIVFELEPPVLPGGNWTETVLYAFTGARDGGYPNSIAYRDGALYGAVTFGGDPKYCGGFGCGGVFRLNPPASAGGKWEENVIYSFRGSPDGLYPAAGPVIGKDGSLYGTTRDGGDAQSCPQNPGCGVVYELNPTFNSSGRWAERVLHRFTADQGAEPTSPLVIGADGSLYGTTYIGGTSLTCSPNSESFPSGCGAVFAVKPK